MAAVTPPDAAVAIAFKEWAGVCDALGSGRQSLILRKGGVAEGPGGFRPDHPAFWLYPTHVHEAEQGLREPGPGAIPEEPAVVRLETLAVVAWVGRVESPGQLDAIEPFHGWTAATIRKRFDYRAPGLWAIAIRAFRRAEPWPIPILDAHLGCKTWVPLDDPPPPAGLVPGLDERASAERLDRLRAAIGRAS